MRRTIFSLCLALGVLGLSSTAMADSPDEPTTFEGSCEFEGSVKYPNPPLQFTPTVTPEFVQATGPCTGQFGDETLDGDTVKLEFESVGPLSCAAGGTTQGSGVLKFRGQKLDFSVVETRPPGIVSNFVLTGDNGGGASMQAMADFEGDQGEVVVRKCARSAEKPQTGIRLIPLRFVLNSPGISG